MELLTSGELIVVDADDHEVPHDGKTIGEIVVRGNAVMHGYYNDPKSTAEAFRGGWFRTGDAAVVHQDGYAEVRDRIKDVIISGGENISSVEVEGLLLRHPAISEVAVVGLADDRWGEAPHAFVVLKPDASATEDELRQFARQCMAHFKVPKCFNFVPDLPKTATGKIQKYILRGGVQRSACSNGGGTRPAPQGFLPVTPAPMRNGTPTKGRWGWGKRSRGSRSAEKYGFRSSTPRS